MSIPTKRAEPRAQTGFSLMEILVVLTILALSTAIIMPSTSRMLDQATGHAVFFEFQRQVSDLRREANRTGMPIRMVDPEAAGALAENERVIELREPWRYTLAPALEIAEGGACSPATANLVNGDRVVMTLRSEDAGCRFIRQQITAGPPRAPASR
jgi:prepilin-type N-terminal cleavage/methylation domain-containing protein